MYYLRVLRSEGNAGVNWIANWASSFFQLNFFCGPNCTIFKVCRSNIMQRSTDSLCIELQALLGAKFVWPICFIKNRSLVTQLYTWRIKIPLYQPLFYIYNYINFSKHQIYWLNKHQKDFWLSRGHYMTFLPNLLARIKKKKTHKESLNHKIKGVHVSRPMLKIHSHLMFLNFVKN